ncbi:MAG: PDZ domain-containing protein, partial [Pseudomonadota bacterium]
MSTRPLLLVVLGCLAADAADAERGYLGMKVGAHDDQIVISQVFPGSNAEQAGLQEGDTLMSVDGHPLAGLTVKQAVDLLTGPVGSRAKVERDPFPPGGDTARVQVLRGPRPAEDAAGGRSLLPPVEREANVLVGALRAGRTPAVESAVKVWAAAEPPAEADRALLRALREADATGWAQGLDGARI